MRTWRQHTAELRDGSLRDATTGGFEEPVVVSVDDDDGTVRVKKGRHADPLTFTEADWLAVRDACEALRKEAGRP